MMPRKYSEGKMGDMDVNICKYNKTINHLLIDHYVLRVLGTFLAHPQDILREMSVVQTTKQYPISQLDYVRI